MITLPNTTRNRATFRILTMPEGTWTPTQVWIPLPIPAVFNRATGAIMSGTVAQGGYELDSVSRWCLPDEDRAQFHLETGTINGVHISPLSLTNTVVRIQVLDDEQFPNGSASLPSSGWKTVFVGSVIYASHTKHVGESDCGRTTYYCAGILARTRLWPVDRHSTATATHAKGNPGYNVPLNGWFRRVLGNKGSGTSGDPFTDLGGTPDLTSYYVKHALPIDGTGAPDTKFTDADVVKHLVASSRARGEVKIEVQLENGLFDGAFSWPVNNGDDCYTLLRRICNRQRGRGAVFVHYADASSLGDVSIILKARMPTASDMVYNTVETEGDLTLTKVNTIKAATNGVDAVDVDLNGDHRVTDDGFRFDDRQTSVMDGLVVQGERIQVCLNLNFFGASLGKRWSSGSAGADQELFAAIPAIQIQQRTSARWRHVWRRYGVPSGWGFTVKAISTADTAYGVNYTTDDNGGIINNASYGKSSEITFRVMSDLPIYEGWRYDARPAARYDGAADYLPPSRMPPQVTYKADTNRGTEPTWFPLGAAGFNIQTDDFGFYIVNGNEEGTGVRYLANSTDAPYAYSNFAATYGVADVTTTSGMDLNKFNTIVGVELGSRVSVFKKQVGSVATYDQLGRKMVMTVDGIHLWLGAPGAMWELDYARAALSNKWNAGLRFPEDRAAYVIRDDRNMLSFIAALAWEFYGSVHNPGTWTLKDCGFLNSFQTINGNVSYPTLGQLIGKVTYGGEGAEGPDSVVRTADLRTPVTSIHYDHQAGQTTWRTDFVAFDGNIQ